MEQITAADGYEGVTVAGLAVVRNDGEPSVFLAQRSHDETDDPEVRETWEWPGGHLNPDEEPYEAAVREFGEEIGFPLPPGEVIGGWRSEDGHYQGFVYEPNEWPGTLKWSPTEEVQAVGWFTREMIEQNENIRPEVRDQTDWDMIFGAVSGNEEDEMDETEMDEPELSMTDLVDGPLLVHGVLAPEEAESGDSRGFNAGAVTRRDYRLPFMWQKEQTPGHDKAVVTGSVDRLMRKDGLIHWEGSLMPTAEAGEFAELLAFFGRFGVSVDGDRGNADMEKTTRTGVLWYDAVRAAGLTAVSIPAFAEAYVAFGPHPDMPSEETLTASMVASGEMVTFKRGPGWATHPKETRRLHAYWTKKGQPGYAKIRWGTPGDFTRAKKLIGAKIGANSPEDLRFLNQIIAQWHFDALGYWPGELGKPGNPPDTKENRRRAATHASLVSGNGEVAASVEDVDYAADAEEAVETVDSIERTEEGWEVVLTSSAAPTLALPPMHYFDRHPDSGATVIDPPDENGVVRTYGYAAEWGVCHIGFDGQCVGVPEDPTGADYPEFHLGRTRTEDGYIATGLITYKTVHRSGKKMLSQSAEQAHYENVASAWAAVRLGEDDRGVWFSGVVLPHVPEEDRVLIEASGQVSGEWKYGALRGLQSVNIPGFPVMRASAEFDEKGEVALLVASTFNNTTECEPTPSEKMAALAQADAEVRWDRAKALFTGEA